MGSEQKRGSMEKKRREPFALMENNPFRDEVQRRLQQSILRTSVRTGIVSSDESEVEKLKSLINLYVAIYKND